MFKISFKFLDKTYSATVQIIEQQSVKYIVFGVMPRIGVIPERLVYQSNPAKDQLVYQSFNVNEATMLRSIGESIFRACLEQKINVHTGMRETYSFNTTVPNLKETLLRKGR